MLNKENLPCNWRKIAMRPPPSLPDIPILDHTIKSGKERGNQSTKGAGPNNFPPSKTNNIYIYIYFQHILHKKLRTIIIVDYLFYLKMKTFNQLISTIYQHELTLKKNKIRRWYRRSPVTLYANNVATISVLEGKPSHFCMTNTDVNR